MSLRLDRLIRALALAPVSFLALCAQVAPPPPVVPEVQPADEEVVELSPFTITALADRGYQARSTLAGSRLNADLVNVPSQISVMTKEFLEDISAGSLEDALPYSLNVEGISEFSSSEAGRRNFIDNLNDGQSNRARGLTGVGTTVNFFPTDIPTSSYNIERFTFLSGPNAILYGSGSPAGIVDASLLPVRNLSRTQLRLTTRTDDEQSWKHTADLNMPLMRDVLGVRIAAQNEDTNSFKRPAGNRDDRLYATFLLRPTRATTIRGWAETVRIRYTPVRTTQIFDNVSHWLAAGRPLYNNSPSQPQPPQNAPLLTRDTTNAVRQFFTVGQTLAPVPTMSWRGSATLASLEEIRPAPDAFWQALLDPNVYPRDVSVWGNAFGSRTNGRTYGLSAQHEFSPALWGEVSLYHQHSELRLARTMSPIDMVLRADPNMFLPGTNTPNPNVGRYFIQSEGGQQNKRWRRQQSLRASLVYQHDFTRQRPWLGRHRLSASFETGENDAANQTLPSRIISPVPGLSDDLVNTAGEGLRRPIWRAYVDNPQDPNSGGVYSVNLPFDIFADTVTLADGTRINLWDLELYGSGNQGTWTRTGTRGYVAALESFLLKDRLAITAGFRHDESKIRRAFSERLGNGNINAGFEPFTRLKGKLGAAERQEGDTASAGFVFHVRKGISVFANRSKTYTPPPQGFNPDGTSLEGSSGIGTDFGVMLSLLDERLGLRANVFTNTSKNVSSNFQTDIAGRIYDMERTVVLAGEPLDPGGYNPMIDAGSYYVRGSRKSKGVELELTANPTRNLRFVATAAKSESHEDGVGQPWIDLAIRRVDVWSRHATDVIWDASTTVRNRFNAASPPLVEMMGVQSIAVEQSRDWRLNGTTRYSFDRSWLKGAFVGGSVRYRSKNVVGFAQKEVPNPFTAFAGQGPTISVKDADRPYYGNRQESFDAFVGYTRKLDWGRSINWRVQLAVKNVFDDGTLQIQGVYSNGDRANFTIPEPRRWILTSSFDF
ncbi:MAG: TonB-dependent receptor plug domain-containing protein [Opitutaceae bacterium]|nr:TonB-dependent receptor plug domain-containing protein [Opitutaceae bacterium]